MVGVVQYLDEATPTYACFHGEKNKVNFEVSDSKRQQHQQNQVAFFNKNLDRSVLANISGEKAYKLVE